MDDLLTRTYEPAGLYEAAWWYDLDYAAYVGEAAFYDRVVAAYHRPGTAYTELGAGTGRVLLRQAARGVRCHAVEPARPMIERLVAHAESMPLESGDVSAEWGEAATFEGPDDVPSSVIAFPFNGVFHLEDRAALEDAFSQVRARLMPDGVFALDHTGPSWSVIAAGTLPWGHVEERADPESGARYATYDTCAYDAATRVLTTRLRFVGLAADVGVELTVRQRLWTWQETVSALERTGFTVESVDGDVNGAPFHEGAPRMLIVAR